MMYLRNLGMNLFCLFVEISAANIEINNLIYQISSLFLFKKISVTKIQRASVISR